MADEKTNTEETTKVASLKSKAEKASTGLRKKLRENKKKIVVGACAAAAAIGGGLIAHKTGILEQVSNKASEAIDLDE